jgi:hypothetical protein
MNQTQLRARLGSVTLEEGPLADTLGIALCTYFSRHLDCPEDDEATVLGWGPWVIAKANEALDRIAADLAQTLFSTIEE